MIQEIILGIVSDYPILIYIFLGIFIFLLICVLVFAIINFKQGREFSTPVFSFGATQKSEIDLEQIESLIKNEMKKFQMENLESFQNKDLYIYLPTKMSERTKHYLEIKLDIEKKIKEIIVSISGGFPGVSYARPQYFISILHGAQIMDEEFFNLLGAFYYLFDNGYFNDSISDSQFMEFQILAREIMGKLKEIPLGRYQESF